MNQPPRVSRAWLTATFLVCAAIPPHSWASEIAPSEVCAVLGNLSELVVVEGAEGPGDCAAILECRFEARQAAGLTKEEGSALTMEEACKRVGKIQSLAEAQIRSLADGLPKNSPEGCQKFLGCVAAAVAEPQGTPDSSSPGSVSDWKGEFDRICAQVPIAGSLTVEQLQQLIADTESLFETLKESDVPQAKLFLQRLEMCRSFFEYSIELLTTDADEAQE